MTRCSGMVWNVTEELEDSALVEFEFELVEFDARPESKLVVLFRHPLETDSTVAMLALLSSPGLSLPGL